MEPNVFDQIKEVDLKKTMEKSYIDYAMSVIAARALPDVRDGLKPVQRRILFSMFELNNGPDKAHRKCARIVGDTMGKYHPHGDSSIYGALVNMAQEWAMRNCLVDGHGNFGSIDGDGAAAMRYTEARLSKIAMEMIADINKDTVDFVPNFDETEQEPVVLPSRYPNLLVNGAQGIAVGMATNIPPHNLREVVAAVDCLIENKIADRETTLDEVISLVKGPDFPTGATILGKSGVLEAYRTGRGKIRVRAVTNIEPMQNGKHRIVVTELPYLVNKARLIEKIADLVRDKRVDGITDLRDESNREGMRIVIELRKDVNPQIVLNRLLKHTQLEDTFGVIMLALVNNEPRVLNLLQMLEHYLEHQKDVVTRRTRYDLNRAEERAHILKGLLIALDHIDEVIRIIRESRSVALAKQSLMERFALTDVQAQAIVDMRLRALTGLEREKLEAEYQELERKIAYFKSILEDEKKLLAVIQEEMDLVAEKYGDDRRTGFGISDEMEAEDLIPDEVVVVAMTNRGYIKRMNPDFFRNQARGGKGIRGMQTIEDDFITDLLMTTTHRPIDFFTNKGRLYRLKVYQIPDASRTARGTAIVNLLQLQPDEKVTAMISYRKKSETKYLFMATKQGMVKKTELSAYMNVRSNGLAAIALREDDELIGVKASRGTEDVLLVTQNGQSILFSEGTVRVTGRNSYGVKGIALREGDAVVAMQLTAQGEELLTVTAYGMGKRTELTEFHAQNRGGYGNLCHKLTDKTGLLIGAKLVREDREILLITNTGVMIRISVGDISKYGRLASGVKLMNIERDGEEEIRIAGIATVKESMSAVQENETDAEFGEDSEYIETDK
ncbi:DNA gyrase subunit A [Stomatobaculum longum]|uniref:DNA gyrase subunit A n=1 Tax=Stomatobaculum longum TaxID=796942 RepID=UPI0028DC9E80|nr:DNA gyrase subunit A [Stomatobaculum longum]